MTKLWILDPTPEQSKWRTAGCPPCRPVTSCSTLMCIVQGRPTRSDVVVTARVDQPQVLRGHTNERETHNLESSVTDSGKPVRLNWCTVLSGTLPPGLRDHDWTDARYCPEPSLQVFETTVRSETSANGLAATKNVKSGSKTSPYIFSSSFVVVYFVYYESMKRKLKIKPTYECRCNGRLQTKRFTRLSHTVLVVELFICNRILRLFICN
jgi:hypothetical protein